MVGLQKKRSILFDNIVREEKIRGLANKDCGNKWFSLFVNKKTILSEKKDYRKPTL